MDLLDGFNGDRIKIGDNLYIPKMGLGIGSFGSFGEIKDLDFFLHVKISKIIL